MLRAAPVVDPVKDARRMVPEPVMLVFDVVKANVAPPAILGEVKLTDTTRPLAATVPDAAPDAVVGTVTNPVPAPIRVKLPVIEAGPGVVNGFAKANVTVPAVVDAVIWFIVPTTARISPEELASCTQLAERTPALLVKPKS
jgi:hypothetical protein